MNFERCLAFDLPFETLIRRSHIILAFYRWVDITDDTHNERVLMRCDSEWVRGRERGKGVISSTARRRPVSTWTWTRRTHLFLWVFLSVALSCFQELFSPYILDLFYVKQTITIWYRLLIMCNTADALAIDSIDIWIQANVVHHGICTKCILHKTDSRLEDAHLSVALQWAMRQSKETNGNPPEQKYYLVHPLSGAEQQFSLCSFSRLDHLQCQTSEWVLTLRSVGNGAGALWTVGVSTMPKNE